MAHDSVEDVSPVTDTIVGGAHLAFRVRLLSVLSTVRLSCDLVVLG